LYDRVRLKMDECMDVRELHCENRASLSYFNARFMEDDRIPEKIWDIFLRLKMEAAHFIL